MNEPRRSQGLRDRDYAEWVDSQVALLRTGRFAELDLPNLIEEVDDLRLRHVHAIQNRLVVLMAHLLKLRHQPEKATPSWRSTVLVQRDRIAMILESSPSLRRLLAEQLPRRYPNARRLAAAQTGLRISTFPAECPFGVWDVMEAPVIEEG